MHALSKASKPCEDQSSSKESDKPIIANEHPNDVIDVTQDDSNFNKRLMFCQMHYGSLPNKKMKSIAKTDTYARINFKKGVIDVLNRQQRERAHFYERLWAND